MMRRKSLMQPLCIQSSDLAQGFVGDQERARMLRMGWDAPVSPGVAVLFAQSSGGSVRGTH